MQQRSNNDSGPNQHPKHVNITFLNWRHDPVQIQQGSNNDSGPNQHPNIINITKVRYHSIGLQHTYTVRDSGAKDDR